MSQYAIIETFCDFLLKVSTVYNINKVNLVNFWSF